MNQKYTLVQRLSGALGGLYGRFKREVVPPDNARAVTQAETALQGAIDVAARLASDFNVPELVRAWPAGHKSFAKNRGALAIDSKFSC